MTKRLLSMALLLALVPAPLLADAAGATPHPPSEAVFLLEIVLLLVCGRLLGEAMLRVGQPAVMGQLIAGALLGPSVLGALWPGAEHALFPDTGAQRSMIDAVANLGILMLLLLAGMEADLSVVGKLRRTAVSVSLAGISVPFACGFALGELLPQTMLPHPGARLLTALFLGTALSISSVKIVAMTIRELNFLRRTLGQVIVAAAIIDDALGWIIIAVILGLALHGAVDAASLTRSIVGTVLFLGLSFTLGRRAVFFLIRWTNDNFVSEMPVITAILVVMAVMALITHAIGVHTVLGAFVAGILVGQSPILTRHIDEQLRGLITALFMPVFFGLAGLSADLRVLGDPSLLLLALALIAIASLGKFSGAFLGAAFAGMTWREALALGCGMNARGSTEVIVASIGLSTGALNQPLYTIIVAMAVVTTLAMPPMLRWAVARAPLRREEKERLEREAFETRAFLPNVERLLVAADDSPNGRFASYLAGSLSATQRLPTTVLEVGRRGRRRRAPSRSPGVGDLAAATAEAVAAETPASEGEPQRPPAEIHTRVSDARPVEEAVAREAKKGYDLLLIGVEPGSAGGEFSETVTTITRDFEGPFAITDARGVHRKDPLREPLDILVPVSGTIRSRRGAEVAMALARAGAGAVTALYVAPASARRRNWQRRFGTAWAEGSDEEAILREIIQFGDQVGVVVRTALRRRGDAQEAILRQLEAGGHNLVVMGVSPRAGANLSFGDVAAAVLEQSRRSILFVSS